MHYEHAQTRLLEMLVKLQFCTLKIITETNADKLSDETNALIEETAKETKTLLKYLCYSP